MRGNLLLLTGCLAGILLAASGLFESGQTLSLPGNSIATVNGIDIPKQQLLTIVKSIEEEKNSQLDKDAYEYFLQKLIDEELMVQRGQELGLLQLNSTLRNNIRMALVESILADNTISPPSKNELQDLYENDQAFFSTPERLRVKLMRFESRENALKAENDLRNGYDFETVKGEYAKKEVMDIPEGWLSIRELRNYIGPTLTQKASETEINNYSEIIEHQGSWYLIRVVDQELGEAPPFEDIEEAVKSEFIRRKNSEAIASYLEFLRSRADIERKPIEEIISSVK